MAAPPSSGACGRRGISAQLITNRLEMNLAAGDRTTVDTLRVAPNADRMVRPAQFTEFLSAIFSTHAHSFRDVFRGRKNEFTRCSVNTNHAFGGVKTLA